MSKKEINRKDGKLTPQIKRKMYTETAYNQLDFDIRKQIRIQEGPKLGIRTQVLNAYGKNKNREDAYHIADIMNKKIGRKVYSKKIIDKWIDEENKQRKAIEEHGNVR